MKTFSETISLLESLPFVWQVAGENNGTFFDLNKDDDDNDDESMEGENSSMLDSDGTEEEEEEEGTTGGVLRTRLLPSIESTDSMMK